MSDEWLFLFLWLQQKPAVPTTTSDFTSGEYAWSLDGPLPKMSLGYC